jgi:hypothetical protein
MSKLEESKHVRRKKEDDYVELEDERPKKKSKHVKPLRKINDDEEDED